MRRTNTCFQQIDHFKYLNCVGLDYLLGVVLLNLISLNKMSCAVWLGYYVFSGDKIQEKSEGAGQS